MRKGFKFRLLDMVKAVGGNIDWGFRECKVVTLTGNININSHSIQGSFCIGYIMYILLKYEVKVKRKHISSSCLAAIYQPKAV